MKTWFMAFLVLSSTAFAQELDATDALTRTLRLGTYQGVSVEGASCEVTLRSTSRGILVTATADQKTLSRDIERGTVYRWKPGQRSFLSSERRATNDGSTESVFRTIAVTEKTQYVVVSNRSITTARTSYESKIECVIDL